MPFRFSAKSKLGLLHSLLLITSILNPKLAIALWSEGEIVTHPELRKNPLSLDDETYENYKKMGEKHTLLYPVFVTGLSVPLAPFERILEADSSNPIRKILPNIVPEISPFKNLEDFYSWLGLTKYPEKSMSGIYNIQRPLEVEAKHRIGAGEINVNFGKALSFSCATCHSSQLFGKSVMGLPNKGVRANHFFTLAEKIIPLIDSRAFQLASFCTENERKIYARTRNNLFSVSAQSPLVLGLDTSLYQVSMSLSKRKLDEEASKSKYYELFPRQNWFDHHRADSKPGVWWTLRYKNKWLSDGSIVSGNPILTNILWNEIGRGSDLAELDQWLEENRDIVDALTTYLFSTQAPRWTDFFPKNSIKIQSAKRGAILFKENCMKCHGDYKTNWENLENSTLSYHEDTPVIDVGTDPNRREGMNELADQLNNLKISKKWGILAKKQNGYVPPPLTGIWARYPYFHNNSAPNLCAVLSLPENRPKSFYQGPAENINEDFDNLCVGYPTGDKIPNHWKSIKDAYYDTQKVGLSNKGHSKMLINSSGQEKFTSSQKMDLIEYLKTL
ncbi:MAG: hypothetical protein KA116_06095 [Proteobacteria bacterium]|nr:hypothetical protein [Pseudomonadota bacterium]